MITLSLSAQQEPQKVVTKCKATTTKGTPCKNNASEILKDGYCRVHSPQTPKCGVKTKSGKPCKMIVDKQGDKCKYYKANE